LNLNSHFRRFDTRFTALSVRERLIIMLLSFALLVALAQFLVFMPMLNAYRAEQQQQLQAKARNDILENEYAQLQSFVANQTDVQEVAQLEQQLKEINERVETLGNRMVNPEQMAELLQMLLNKESKLTVLSVEKLPLAEPDKQDESRLIRHKLRITLKGSYFDSLQYLKDAEKLPWQVFWDRIDYQVTDYPIATMTIEVATLGEHRGWLGG